MFKLNYIDVPGLASLYLMDFPFQKKHAREPKEWLPDPSHTRGTWETICTEVYGDGSLHLKESNESEETYSIDMPGFEKDEIEFQVDESKRRIFIDAKTADGKRTKSFTYIVPEIFAIEPKAVTLKNGVLEFVLTKEKEKKRKKITIQ